MDILAVDSNNRIYNIEIQRSDRGADAKRARYNSSLIDANMTEAGDKYDALTETYVIFITENDVLKAGLTNLSCCTASSRKPVNHSVMKLILFI